VHSSYGHCILCEVAPDAWLAAVSSDAEGNTWLYGQSDANGNILITRYRLDKPEVNEVVWNKSKTIGRFTVSTDGKYGAGAYDNPGTGQCGVFELPNAGFTAAAQGCQPVMMPGTNPYRLSFSTAITAAEASSAVGPMALSHHLGVALS